MSHPLRSRRRPFRIAIITAAVLATTGSLVTVATDAYAGTHNLAPSALASTSQSTPPSAAPSDGTIREWLTSEQLADPRTISLAWTGGTSTPPADTAVHVDPSVGFQRVTGFGAALTDSSADMLYQLDPAIRAAVMQQLFSPTAGAGIGFLRQPIGASDFVAKADYSFDDMPPRQTDYDMRHFSIAHDEAQILPLLREARSLNPALQIVASPWSPPAWMKTGDSMIDGKLIDTSAIYQAYARYLVKFLQAYQRAGVPVNYITVQNEPQALQRDNYPGTDMSWQQEDKVIDALGPAIKAAGLTTKILGFDHNWAEHPFDVESHVQVGEDPEVDYPYNLLDSSAARWISGTAYHCYYGDPSAQTALKASFPAKGIYETECDGGDISTAIGVLNNWGQTVTYWNLALDENHGPHVGGCTGCTGTVTISSQTRQVTYNAQYYVLAHLGRFVGSGAMRIASTATNTAGAAVSVQTVGFQNLDGSVVLVATNSSTTAAQTFTVEVSGKSFTTTLDPGDTASYVWR